MVFLGIVLTIVTFPVGLIIGPLVAIMGLTFVVKQVYAEETVIVDDVARPVRSRYISNDVKAAVIRRDEGRCVVCSATEDIQFDHIIPWSKGGSNNQENIQVLCGDCNRRKSNSI
jgi:hypothetical protein